uniref:Putative ixodes 10 kDa peptide protein n=1 Tax=Ixodes ricinus TaxID=34613 RepID=A0A0K8RJ38_IXORI
MQLVVFTVMLILPSFLSGESSATIDEVSNECEGSIVNGGEVACERKGSHYFGYDLRSCAVTCTDRKIVKLPGGVCSNDKVKVCTSVRVKQRLRDWVSKMLKRSI